MAYKIKVLTQDGNDREFVLGTERMARQRALSIYTLRAERGERCTVRIYRDNYLIGLVNDRTVNREVDGGARNAQRQGGPDQTDDSD